MDINLQAYLQGMKGKTTGIWVLVDGVIFSGILVDLSEFIVASQSLFGEKEQEILTRRERLSIEQKNDLVKGEVESILFARADVYINGNLVSCHAAAINPDLVSAWGPGRFSIPAP